MGRPDPAANRVTEGKVYMKDDDTKPLKDDNIKPTKDDNIIKNAK